MMRCLAPFVLIVALVAAGDARAASPLAEVICEPTGKMYDRLQQRLRVSRAASGLRDQDQVIELWSGDSGKWALVATYATGISCLLAMGEDWQTFTPKIAANPLSGPEG
jgi:predicted methyltransferase